MGATLSGHLAALPAPRRDSAAGAPLARSGFSGHTRDVTRTYTREEADEILRRALAGGQTSAGDGSGIGHDDLVAAAREVGIPADAIEAAAGQLGEHRIVNERVERLRKKKQRAFVRHFIIYAIVNSGIFLFDWFDGGPWFFQFPLIVWGVLLLVLGVLQLAPNMESLTRRAERELERERRRAAKQLRIAARTGRTAGGPGGVKAFEAAVEEGVNALMSAAAQAIRGLTPEGKKFRAEEPREDEEDGAHPSQRAQNRRRGPGRV
jgi:2TM domain-containing protein